MSFTVFHAELLNGVLKDGVNGPIVRVDLAVREREVSAGGGHLPLL